MCPSPNILSFIICCWWHCFINSFALISFPQSHVPTLPMALPLNHLILISHNEWIPWLCWLDFVFFFFFFFNSPIPHVDLQFFLMLTQEEEGVWELIVMQERDRCPINIHCSLHFFPTFTLLSLSTLFFIVNYEFFQHYLLHRTDSLHWEIRLNTKTSFFFFFSEVYGKTCTRVVKKKKKWNKQN